MTLSAGGLRFSGGTRARLKNNEAGLMPAPPEPA